ncbi:MAG: efflux RND transporter permease subunit, partial [Gammaproteobacteria bacterium]|nr:efflux RND transporter permease subunit [Gammaproteobacteria bacterium]
GVKLRLYDEVWKLIDGRIMLLLKNGLGGLALVVLILYLFLNGRVAGWVAAGIPVSLMATQAVLYSFGGSINMVSLFAMIMALGIIVDDAIVVGEDALTHYQNGENPLEAAEGGARRMLAPVMASSLTSIAAFMPLMLISGAMGNILFAIPLVVVCVILASLLECFLVLPGHLHHSFLKLHHRQAPPLRRHLDSAVEHLREKHFRPLISAAISWRWTVLSAALALLILGVGLLVGGRLNFTFFPTAEGMILSANVNFAAGTPPARVDAFLSRLEKSLKTAEQKLGGGLVTIAISLHGSASSPDGSVRKGDQFGSMRVELLPPDNRSVRNREFIKTWKALTLPAPGLENFTISERRGGPPGRDIDISLSGDDPEQMKAAAEELTAALKTFPGVSAIGDNMPFGREQLVYRLRPEAIARGLTVESTGSQLRAAFDGRLVQIFLDGKDEVEVRVMLPDEERYHLATLNHLTIRLPDGAGMPLLNCVELTPRRGFEALRHQQGKLAVGITADVDKELNNSNKILDKLSETLLTELSSRYHLEYSLEGRAADQAETLADMMRGLVFALALIYLVLAWVFSSYGWPLAVMAAIPFGLIGALTGHLLMNIDLTILSLFGFFGLSGIVVNDSIVLVMFYKQQREAGSGVREGLIEAACQRLRAVLLTSLTTIGGLLPLLFETSLEAQFLIPMAVSISFGLIFSTVLVLLVVPVLLSIYEKPIMNDERQMTNDI